MVLTRQTTMDNLYHFMIYHMIIFDKIYILIVIYIIIIIINLGTVGSSRPEPVEGNMETRNILPQRKGNLIGLDFEIFTHEGVNLLW